MRVAVAMTWNRCWVGSVLVVSNTRQLCINWPFCMYCCYIVLTLSGLIQLLSLVQKIIVNPCLALGLGTGRGRVSMIITEH